MLWKVLSAKSQVTLGLLVALSVVGALLLLSRSAQALRLTVDNLPGSVSSGNLLDFDLTAEFEAGDLVPFQEFRLDILGPSPIIARFRFDGTVLVKDPAVVSITSVPTPCFTFGYGYRFAQTPDDNGNGKPPFGIPGAGEDNLHRESFGYGFGFGYGYGYGYSPVPPCSVKFHVVVDTSVGPMEPGDYEVRFSWATGMPNKPTFDAAPGHFTIVGGVLTADFENVPDRGVAPLDVQFTDRSVPVGQITDWAWTFFEDLNGNNVPDPGEVLGLSTLQDPLMHFDQGGDISVRLRVSNGPVTDTVIHINAVRILELADILANGSSAPVTVAAGDTVNFTGITRGAVTAYSWDLDGDGIADSTDASPSHVYTQAGTYDVSLRVLGFDGVLTDTLVKAGFVNVNPGQLTEVVVTPPAATTQVAGAGVQFSAQARDQFGNVFPPGVLPLAWSLDEADTGGAAVDQTGFFAPGTGARVLTVRATATQNGVERSGTARVTVEPGPLDRVDVTPNPAVVPVQGQQQFAAAGFDAFNNPIPGLAFAWELVNGPPDGALDQSGLFTAGTTSGTFNNTVQATATYKGSTRSGAATVIIPAGPLSRVVVTPPAAVTEVAGAQVQFTARAEDELGNPLDLPFFWEIVEADRGGASIDQAGRFTPGTGARVLTVRATATQDGVVRSGTAQVTVEPGPLDQVTVTPDPVSLRINEQRQFAAAGSDAFGNPIPGLAFAWALVNGPPDGSLDQTGLFTAGTTVGTFNNTVRAMATYKGSTKSDAATVTVLPGPLDHVVIDPKVKTLRVRETHLFTAQAFDQANNPIQGLVPQWTGLAGGTVDQNGLFTAGTVAGTFDPAVQVCMTQNGTTKCDTAKVVVQPGPLVQVVVTPDPGETDVLGQIQFSAQGKDQFGNVIQEGLAPFQWSVVGSPVPGTIDGNTGLFTAGQVAGFFLDAIRAQTQGASGGPVAGTADVVIRAGRLTTLDVMPDDAIVPLLGTNQFVAVARDQFGNLFGPELTIVWEILEPDSDTVLQPVEPGNPLLQQFMVGTKAGTVHVRATATKGADVLSDTSTVTIPPDPLDGVVFEPDPLAVSVNQQAQVTGNPVDQYGNVIPGIPVTLFGENLPSDGIFDPATGIFTAGSQMGLFPKAFKGEATEHGWRGALQGAAGLNAVFFTDASTGWAVGNGGLILHTEDGGRSWGVQSSGTTEDLHGVSFANASEGHAVGANGTILTTVDGGERWMPQAPPAGMVDSFFDVFFTDASTGVAVGTNGAIITTQDGGATWQAQQSGVTTTLRGVYLTDSSTGYAVGDNGTFVKTTQGGAEWKPEDLPEGIPADSFFDVFFTDSSTGWVVGANGAIIHTEDGGATWQAQQSGVNGTLRGVHMTDASTGWAVGDNGTVLTTVNGGANWTPEAPPPGVAAESFFDVFFTDASTGWAVGSRITIIARASPWAIQLTAIDLRGADCVNGLICWAVGLKGQALHTTDGGVSFSALNTGTEDDLLAVDFVDAQHGWAVGANGTVLKAIDGGATWQLQASNTAVTLRGVSFVDAQRGWVVGEGGTVLATADGGATWAPQGSGIGSPLNGVYFVDAQKGWVVGDGGVILATANGGNTWTTQVSGTGQALRAVQMVSATKGWAVGASGTILATADGGSNWAAQASGTVAGLNDLFFLDDTTGWAVGTGGTVLHTGDGLAWAAQASGTTADLYAVTGGGLSPAVYLFAFGDSSTALRYGRFAWGYGDLRVLGELARVVVTPAEATTEAGGAAVQFSAQGQDAGGNVLDVPIVWSIDEADAGGSQVDQTGLFTPGTKAGTYTVRATATQDDIVKSGTARATVNPGPLAEVVVTPAEATTEAGGAAVQFSAQAKDAFGNVLGVPLVWSIDEADTGGASVDQNGLFTPGAGARVLTVRAEASQNGIVRSGTAQVRVEPGPLARVDVTPNPVTLRVQGQQQFGAAGFDALNNPIPGLAFTWLLVNGPADGSLSAAGLLHAGTTPGTFTNTVQATATFKGATVSGAATVNVLAGLLNQVVVTPAEATTEVSGATVQFSAQARDAFGNAINLPIAWSIDEADAGGASIGQTGLFTPGTGARLLTVRATAAEEGLVRSGTARVTVEPGALRQVVVTPNPASVPTLGQQQFGAVGFDRFGNPIAGLVFGWAVVNGPPDGFIDGAGLFRGGVTAGTFVNTVQATATFKGATVSGFATVTILPGPLARVVVTPAQATTEVGGAAVQFAARAEDEHGNAINLPISWSIDEADRGGAAVDHAGLFTPGTKAGAFTVRAAASQGGVERSGTAQVTVEPGRLARVVVSPDPAAVALQGQQQFAAAGFDAFNNAIPGLVFGWALVNGPADGSLSGAGLFQAGTTAGTFAGTVQATATYKGATISGVATVTVLPGPLARVVVTPAQAPAEAGGAAVQFTGRAEDEYGNVLNLPMSWSIDEADAGGAGIDQTGLFTPGTGARVLTVRATATQGNVVQSGTAQVTVEPGPLARVVVSPDPAVVALEGQQQFAAAGFDAFNNPIAGLAFGWALVNGPADGSLSGTGLFQAGTTPGTFADTVEATATYKGAPVSGAATVIVPVGALARVIVTPAEATTEVGGAAVQFSARVEDDLGNEVLGALVVWSIDEADRGGAQIDQTGLFTPGTGARALTVRATATKDNLAGSGTARVTVEPGPLARVVVSPDPAVVALEGQQQFAAAGFDAFNNPIAGLVFGWALVNGPADGSLSGAGLFQAGTTAGTFADTVQATATYKGAQVSGDATVTVLTSALARVVVTPSQATTEVGGAAVQFTGRAEDEHGNVLGLPMSWSIDEADRGGASIDQTGLFTPGTGARVLTVRATATQNGVERSGTAQVTVEPGPLARVDVTPNPAVVALEGQQQFAAAGFDAFNNPIAGLAFGWALVNGPADGSLSAAGLFQAGTTPGTFADTVQAEATYKGATVSGAATVIVPVGALVRVIVTPAQATTAVGGATVQFSGRAEDAFGNLLNLAMTWTIDEPDTGGASIDQTGLFTPGTGARVLTVRASVTQGDVSRSGTARATVEPGPLAQVVVTPNPATVPILGQQQFAAAGFDAFNNPIPGLPFGWDLVDGPADGSLSPAGLFQAGTTAGTFVDTVRATATYKGATVSGRATVSIPVGPLHRVVVTPPEGVTQVAGAAVQFSAQVQDAFGNVLDLSMEWSIDEANTGGASIDQTGRFTPGTRAGTFTVRATAVQDGLASGTALVMVRPGPLAAVTMFINEDLNGNGALDAGEDLNGNAALDTRLSLDPAVVDMTQQVRFFAESTDAFGNVKTNGVALAWNLTDARAGTVDQSGRFVAGLVAGAFPGVVRVGATEGALGVSDTNGVTVVTAVVAVLPQKDGFQDTVIEVPVTFINVPAPGLGSYRIRVRITDRNVARLAGVSQADVLVPGDAPFTSFGTFIVLDDHTVDFGGSIPGPVGPTGTVRVASVRIRMAGAPGSGTAVVVFDVMANDAQGGATTVLRADGHLTVATADFAAAPAPAKGQAPLDVQLTDHSTGNPYAWGWSIYQDNGDELFNAASDVLLKWTKAGDTWVEDAAGVTSIPDQNPKVRFGRGGDFHVALTVTIDPSTTTVVKPLLVRTLLPSFTLAPSLGTAPLGVQITDSTQGTVSGWDYEIYREATGNNSLDIGGDTLVAWGKVDTDSNGTPDTWVEGAGAVTSIPERNPRVRFDKGGIYHVRSVVTGPAGTFATTHQAAVTVLRADFSAALAAGQAGTVDPATGRVEGVLTRDDPEFDVQFTQRAEGPAVAYAWDFNLQPSELDAGGSYIGSFDSSDPNPTYPYTSAGSYTVLLRVTGGGLDDREIKAGIVLVHQAPLADFTNDPATPPRGQAPLTVQLQDLSQGDNPRAFDYEVRLDDGDGALDAAQDTLLTWSKVDTNSDGTPDTWVEDAAGVTSIPDQDPRVRFDRGGDFHVTQMVTNAFGVDSVVRALFVRVLKINFSGTDFEDKVAYALPASPLQLIIPSQDDPNTLAVVENRVQFAGVISGTVTSVAWDLNGDGVTDSVALNPTWDYTVPGRVNVSLTVTGPAGVFTVVGRGEDFNNNGVLDPGEDQNGDGVLDRGFVVVAAQPVADFDTSEDLNGNGVLDAGEDVNGNGELDAETGLGNVTAAPLVARLRDLSSGDPTRWEWRIYEDVNGNEAFDEGVDTLLTWTKVGDTWQEDPAGAQIITDRHPKVRVNRGGDFHVSLRVFRAFSPLEFGSEILTREVIIRTIRASFTADPLDGLAPLSVDFDDTSSEGKIDLVSWDFDVTAGELDAQGNYIGVFETTGSNPTRIYQRAGTKTVVMKVVGPAGEAFLILHDLITVREQAVAGFTLADGYTPDGAAPHMVQLQDASQGHPSRWEYRVYRDNGDSVYQSDLDTELKWTYADTDGDGIAETWVYDSSGRPDIPDQGPRIRFDEGGTFHITQVVQNNNNTSDPFVRQDFIHVLRVVLATNPGYDVNREIVIDPHTLVDFDARASEGNIIQVSWAFENRDRNGNGVLDPDERVFTETAAVPPDDNLRRQHTYHALGTFFATVRITDGTMVDRFTVKVIVAEQPDAAFAIINPPGGTWGATPAANGDPLRLMLQDTSSGGPTQRRFTVTNLDLPEGDQDRVQVRDASFDQGNGRWIAVFDLPRGGRYSVRLDVSNARGVDNAALADPLEVIRAAFEALNGRTGVTSDVGKPGASGNPHVLVVRAGDRVDFTSSTVAEMGSTINRVYWYFVWPERSSARRSSNDDPSYTYAAGDLTGGPKKVRLIAVGDGGSTDVYMVIEVEQP
ncbi:MAG: PKD domain-containing protein [Chloroflexi bacterium]|nr:PKD domain-containing protein [Chloroflexota bacterium]